MIPPTGAKRANLYARNKTESVEQMNFGDIARKSLQRIAIIAAAVTLLMAPNAAQAQDEESAEVAVEEVVEAAPAFDHFGPDMIKGQPSFAEDDFAATMTFQQQYSPTGEYALWMHDYRLLPIIAVICVFVLLLLVWVIFRYRKGANPVPSKTSHNTLIEVIWIVIPCIILLVIAVPSIKLLAQQYESPPEDAITIKANGYQWYWGYEYVDNGGFEVISNMMPEADAVSQGLPPQLEVDKRMVVPVNTPLRIQTFGADVIHSFGIPSLWFKIDAVPGRINEKMMIVEEEGIYYGQCMELCGARHGYMPIAIEARSMEDYEAWVLAQGGTIGEAETAEAEIVEETPVEEAAETEEALEEA